MITQIVMVAYPLSEMLGLEVFQLFSFLNYGIFVYVQ